MTIFDSIRFSDIDIYDKQRMKEIPEEVYNQWMDEYKISREDNPIMNYVDRVYSFVSTSSVKHVIRQGFRSYPRMRENFEKDLKQQMTDRLKEILKDYDT